MLKITKECNSNTFLRCTYCDHTPQAPRTDGGYRQGKETDLDPETWR